MGKLLDDLKNKFSGDAKIPETPNGGPVPVASAGVRNPAIDAARADVVAEVGKRKRGRPRSSGDGVTETSAAPDAELQKIRDALEALYKPEVWEPLMCLPADGAAALTGHKHWELSTKERQTLGATASTAARFMAVENPKWLALSLCATAIITVYTPRIIQELAIRRGKKASDEKEAGKD